MFSQKNDSPAATETKIQEAGYSPLYGLFNSMNPLTAVNRHSKAIEMALTHAVEHFSVLHFEQISLQGESEEKEIATTLRTQLDVVFRFLKNPSKLTKNQCSNTLALWNYIFHPTFHDYALEQAKTSLTESQAIQLDAEIKQMVDETIDSVKHPPLLELELPGQGVPSLINEVKEKSKPKDDATLKKMLSDTIQNLRKKTDSTIKKKEIVDNGEFKKKELIQNITKYKEAAEKFQKMIASNNLKKEEADAILKKWVQDGCFIFNEKKEGCTLNNVIKLMKKMPAKLNALSLDAIVKMNTQLNELLDSEKIQEMNQSLEDLIHSALKPEKEKTQSLGMEKKAHEVKKDLTMNQDLVEKIFFDNQKQFFLEFENYNKKMKELKKEYQDLNTVYSSLKGVDYLIPSILKQSIEYTPDDRQHLYNIKSFVLKMHIPTQKNSKELKSYTQILLDKNKELEKEHKRILEAKLRYEKQYSREKILKEEKLRADELAKSKEKEEQKRIKEEKRVEDQKREEKKETIRSINKEITSTLKEKNKLKALEKERAFENQRKIAEQKALEKEKRIKEALPKELEAKKQMALQKKMPKKQNKAKIKETVKKEQEAIKAVEEVKHTDSLVETQRQTEKPVEASLSHPYARFYAVPQFTYTPTHFVAPPPSYYPQGSFFPTASVKQSYAILLNCEIEGIDIRALDDNIKLFDSKDYHITVLIVSDLYNVISDPDLAQIIQGEINALFQQYVTTCHITGLGIFGRNTIGFALDKKDLADFYHECAGMFQHYGIPISEEKLNNFVPHISIGAMPSTFSTEKIRELNDRINQLSAMKKTVSVPSCQLTLQNHLGQIETLYTLEKLNMKQQIGKMAPGGSQIQ